MAKSPCTLVNTTKPYHCVVDSLTTSHLEKNEMFLDYKDLYGKLDFIEVFDWFFNPIILFIHVESNDTLSENMK